MLLPRHNVFHQTGDRFLRSVCLHYLPALYFHASGAATIFKHIWEILSPAWLCSLGFRLLLSTLPLYPLLQAVAGHACGAVPYPLHETLFSDGYRWRAYFGGKAYGDIGASLQQLWGAEE